MAGGAAAFLTGMAASGIKLGDFGQNAMSTPVLLAKHKYIGALEGPKAFTNGEYSCWHKFRWEFVEAAFVGATDVRMKDEAKNESNIVNDLCGYNFCSRLCCLYHSGGGGGRSGGGQCAPGPDCRRCASQPGGGIRLDWRSMGLAGALGLGSGALGPPAACRRGLGATPLR